MAALQLDRVAARVHAAHVALVEGVLGIEPLRLGLVVRTALLLLRRCTRVHRVVVGRRSCRACCAALEVERSNRWVVRVMEDGASLARRVEVIPDVGQEEVALVSLVADEDAFVGQLKGLKGTNAIESR